MDVKHIAKLANLPLTDEELAKFEPQLEKILEYVEQLQHVDTSSVEETSQITSQANVVRADEAVPFEPLVEGHIKTKAIFSDE